MTRGTSDILILVHGINNSKNNNDNNTGAYHLLSTCRVNDPRVISTPRVHSASQILISPLYNWGSWSAGRLSDLLEIAYPLNIRMSWDSYLVSPGDRASGTLWPNDITCRSLCGIRRGAKSRPGSRRADSMTWTWLKSWGMHEATRDRGMPRRETQKSGMLHRCVRIQPRSEWMAAFTLTKTEHSLQKEWCGSKWWDVQGQYTNKPGLST